MEENKESAEQYGKDDKALVARWLDEIKLAEDGHKKWFEQGDKILKRYIDERPENNSINERRFNVLWSNIETLKPALYNRTPDPTVLRKYKDRDPQARAASEVLERAVKYDLSDGNFDDVMRKVRDDFLLFGRGQAWVRYKPTFVEEPLNPQPQAPQAQIPEQEDPAFLIDEPVIQAEAVSVGDDEESGTLERVVGEDIEFDYVSRKDFLHPMVPIWDKMPWVSRISYMTKDQAKERFDSEVVEKLPVKHKREGASDQDLEKNKELFGRIKVYEIWDKVARRVYWICPDYAEGPLDNIEDPLGLAEFFPCPKPLYGTLTNESLIPVPDYHEYASQAKELDDLSVRIGHITRAIKINGAYNGALPALSRLLSEDNENEMIPVNEWPAFQQTGGLDGHMSFLPVEKMILVLRELQAQRERVKADLYEITGLSDILRGYSNPNATATAEQLKSNFASLRLQERQSRLAEFARGLLRIKAEIIAEHFSVETIGQISNFEEITGSQSIPLDLIVQLLRNDKMRQFRLTVETDATVEPDQQAVKEQRVEFLTAMGGFLEKAFVMSQQAPDVSPVLMEMLRFGVRGFPAARELEEIFDQAIEQMGQQEQDPAQQQALKQQQEQQNQAFQMEMQKVQNDTVKAQAQITKIQTEGQVKLKELELKQLELQQTARKNQADAFIKAEEIEAKAEQSKRDAEITEKGHALDALIKMRGQDLEALMKERGFEVKENADFDGLMTDLLKMVETDVRPPA